jgi:NADPH:quinone reductase-like Zn-dependent oxidoreductase
VRTLRVPPIRARTPLQSKEIGGETVDGGYAEFMLADAEQAYGLPDELGFADAAPLFCPGITGLGLRQHRCLRCPRTNTRSPAWAARFSCI